jgi:hypothetical protein
MRLKCRLDAYLEAYVCHFYSIRNRGFDRLSEFANFDDSGYLSLAGRCSYLGART